MSCSILLLSAHVTADEAAIVQAGGENCMALLTFTLCGKALDCRELTQMPKGTEPVAAIVYIVNEGISGAPALFPITLQLSSSSGLSNSLLQILALPPNILPCNKFLEMFRDQLRAWSL